MNTLLESGKVGKVNQEHLKHIREDVINRWESLGFLDGIENTQIRENIAQLYENQASHLLNEATATGSEGSFETVVFPIVRRVFSKLLAQDIVSVQALNLPIGKLYYFIPKTGRSEFQGANAGIDPNPYSQRAKNLYDTFYGEDGMFDQSKGSYTAYTATVQPHTYQYDGTQSDGYSIKTNNATITSGAVETIQVQFDTTQFRLADMEHAEEFLSSMVIKTTGGTEVDFHLPVQQYGDAIMYPDGHIYIRVAAPDDENINLPDDLTVTARDYENLELNDDMGEVSFELQSVTVTVRERKLRAQWSPELAQDVSAFHNIDAEAELTSLLSEQIAAEIDREILRDLRRGAAWRLTWDYKGNTNRTINVSNGYYTQKDWNQTLITAINQVSAQIHKATLRGGANWIVVSTEASAIFDDLEYFHVSNAGPEQDQYNMGIERIGTLNGRYTVYRDPYFPADQMIIGHKGTSLLDTGYIYAPYVPMQLTPTMYNPFTFAPVKGIMTRYAKKMVNNRFYGKIRLNNIVTFDISGLR